MRPLGHLTDELLGVIIKRRLVLELPFELAAVWPWEVLRVDESAKRGAWVLAKDMDLALSALIEPAL